MREASLDHPTAAMITSALWGEVMCTDESSDIVTAMSSYRSSDGRMLAFPRVFTQKWLELNNIVAIIRGHQHGSDERTCASYPAFNALGAAVMPLWAPWVPATLVEMQRRSWWDVAQVVTVISYGRLSGATPDNYHPDLNIPPTFLELRNNHLRVWK